MCFLTIIDMVVQLCSVNAATLRVKIWFLGTVTYEVTHCVISVSLMVKKHCMYICKADYKTFPLPGSIENIVFVAHSGGVDGCHRSQLWPLVGQP